MANGNVFIRVVMDDRGIRHLRVAFAAANELSDVESWRPEVRRLKKALKRAIRHLKTEVSGKDEA